uniref:Tripartite motif-containing protein 16-like n=1 Tax=Lepisosteus oculatus TaxID=7918 RepID=W5NKL1_LEPOC
TMAEPSTSTAQTCLACTVCLETLKDPVTLPCGHHFCMGCIKSCWDRDNPDCVYKCPQCRKDFPKRPILHRNTVLAAAVDKLRSGMKRPYPSESTAGPGDVLCDVCTGSQVRAVKSCLVCLASYCQTHLQPHCEAAPLKRHQLVEATGQLQEKICSSHDKPLEVYCHTDQRCICMLCTMDEHRGHDTVSAAAGRTEKQKACTAAKPHLLQLRAAPGSQAEDVFFRDACQLTLDPNTAHRHLRLSEGNRRVTWSREPQQYPDHPERFDSEFQVLCREGLSGTHCYWEVEWRGIDIDIGVTYKGLGRRGWGDRSLLGRNDQSWSLYCSRSSCSFWHNGKKTAVAAPPSSRIGVYVDHRAGTLSFYSVSGDTATLLHRVQASFTAPLYPGVRFGPHVWFGFNFVVPSVSLCE